jgi:hypothetical protein
MSVAYDWSVQYPLEWRRELAKVEPPVERPLREELERIRQSLDATLARKLSSASDLSRLVELRRRTSFTTAVAPFDALLGSGLERGKLVELVGRRSTGRFAIVLSTLAATTQSGEAAALVDLGDGFDPQLGEAAGIELPRLLWVRPESVKHAVMSAELLITTGFPLVVVDLGLQLRGRRAHEAAWVRLARAAEAHGAALLLSSPYPTSGTAADAVVTATRSRAVWQGSGGTPRILAGTACELTVEKLRGRSPGRHQPLEVTSPDKPRGRKKSVSRLVEGVSSHSAPPSLGEGAPLSTRTDPRRSAPTSSRAGAEGRRMSPLANDRTSDISVSATTLPSAPGAGEGARTPLSTQHSALSTQSVIPSEGPGGEVGARDLGGGKEPEGKADSRTPFPPPGFLPSPPASTHPRVGMTPPAGVSATTLPSAPGADEGARTPLSTQHSALSTGSPLSTQHSALSTRSPLSPQSSVLSTDSLPRDNSKLQTPNSKLRTLPR